MSSRSVLGEIKAFETQIEKLQSAGHQIEKICHLGYKIYPIATNPSVGSILPKDKDIGFTVTGMIHGNEPMGTAVLNEFLALILLNRIQFNIPIGVAIGNPWAGEENVRFRERDLNRSFLRTDSSLLEEKRADELEMLLSRSTYYLDIHQTSERSERPFFIFPFTKQGFEFARAIGPSHAIVTHWGDPYSTDGRCSDEFVIARGGTGVTIELGQGGFGPYQLEVGVLATIRGLFAAEAYLTKNPIDVTANPAYYAEGDIFTFDESYPYPQEGHVNLLEGLHNFRFIEKGENLGNVDGKPIIASHSGHILFVEYRRTAKATDPRPKALCRVLKKITRSDLPR